MDRVGQAALLSEVTRWRSGVVLSNRQLGSKKNQEESHLSTAMELEGHGLHAGGDKGCFIHSFCTYCTGVCRDDIQSYVSETYENNTGVSVYGFKEAVNNIERTCHEFGYEIL